MWVTSGCVSSSYKSPRAITVAINFASLIQFVLRRKSFSLFEQIEQSFDQHLFSKLSQSLTTPDMELVAKCIYFSTIQSSKRKAEHWSPKTPRLVYALTPVVPNKLELQHSEATGSVKGHIRTKKDTRKRVT